MHYGPLKILLSGEGDLKKTKKKRKRGKKKRRGDGEDGVEDRSDSEAEEERLAAFWEGKHRPCVRDAWVVAKWTMTKREAKQQASRVTATVLQVALV